MNMFNNALLKERRKSNGLTQFKTFWKRTTATGKLFLKTTTQAPHPADYI